MRRCACCARPVAPVNVRPFVCDFAYQLYFECAACMSTMAVTLWEEPEEDALVVAGELRETTNSLSDQRPTEAA